MHFQAYHFPSSLSFLPSGLRFPHSLDTLRILLVPQGWIPVLGCVGGECWCRGDFFCPAITAISQSIPLPWISSCSLAGRLLCPASLLPAHPQPYTGTKRESCVSRISYCQLFAFLHGFSARFPTVNFDFSAKLNRISSEALKKTWFFCPSTAPPLHTLIPLYPSAFGWHQEPKPFLCIRTQTGAASLSTSLTLFSPDLQFCVAAPGCWSILTPALRMQVIIHWRSLEDTAVAAKRTPALSWFKVI